MFLDRLIDNLSRLATINYLKGLLSINTGSTDPTIGQLRNLLSEWATILKDLTARINAPYSSAFSSADNSPQRSTQEPAHNSP